MGFLQIKLPKRIKHKIENSKRNREALAKYKIWLESKGLDPKTLKNILRAAYRSAAGKEHPNWADYDEAMKKDERVAIFVSGDNIYGTIEN